MSNTQNPSTHQVNQSSSPSDVPATFGGRAVTGFSTAGVSVQIAASRKEELEAELLARQLAACNQGMQSVRVFNLGRNQ